MNKRVYPGWQYNLLVQRGKRRIKNIYLRNQIVIAHCEFPVSIRKDENAKDIMHISATMAGIAFSNSGTAAAHALGHSFGATFHVTHGTSVGLFLIPTIKYNSQDQQTREKYLRVSRILGAHDIESLIKVIKDFFTSVGQPIRVKDLGIDKGEYESKLENMVVLSLRDSELAFNPVLMGEEDLKKLILENY